MTQAAADQPNRTEVALTIARLVDAGASAPALVALVRLRDTRRRLDLLEAELDRHALRPVTAARYRELTFAGALLAETAERLTATRGRIEELK